MRNDTGRRRLVQQLLLLGATVFCRDGVAEAGINRWTHADAAQAPILSSATDPANSDTLYAATRGGVVKSTDAGTTWRLPSTDLMNEDVLTVAIDPHPSGLRYSPTSAWTAAPTPRLPKKPTGALLRYAVPFLLHWVAGDRRVDEFLAPDTAPPGVTFAADASAH